MSADKVLAAIEEVARVMCEAEPRLQIAEGEADATTGPRDDARRFLKLDGLRISRDFELYAFMARIADDDTALADFAEVLFATTPAAKDAAKGHVREWAELMEPDNRDFWRRLEHPMTKRVAPCGCSKRSPRIQRRFRILHPTVWVECLCLDHDRTWTDRYEYDFSVPISGKSWEEEAELEERARKEGA